MKDKTISKGFIAENKELKTQTTVSVDIAPLCFYIFIKEDGKTIDQIHRTKLKKAAELVEFLRFKLEKKGYQIKDLGIHHVQIEKETLHYKTKIC